MRIACATLVAVLWAGNTGFPGISMPSPRVLVVVVVVVAVSALTMSLVPPLRRWCPAATTSW